MIASSKAYNKFKRHAEMLKYILLNNIMYRRLNSLKSNQISLFVFGDSSDGLVLVDS
jgi:hypothetical protein